MNPVCWPPAPESLPYPKAFPTAADRAASAARREAERRCDDPRARHAAKGYRLEALPGGKCSGGAS